VRIDVTSAHGVKYARPAIQYLIEIPGHTGAEATMAEDPKRRSNILSALAVLSAVIAVDSSAQAAVSSQSLDELSIDELSIEERVQRVRRSVQDLVVDPVATPIPPHQTLQWANWPNWPNWNNWRNWNNWNNWVNWWNG
jgi:hypothetical protein